MSGSLGPVPSGDSVVADTKLSVDPSTPAKLNFFQKRQQARVLRRSPLCLNCGELTPGDFCACCGQVNDTFRVSTRKLVADFVSDYFTVDLKFFKSAIPLIVKPGFLTNEYIAGRRMRYVAPLRVYLFVSVIYFLLLGFYGNPLFNFFDSSEKTPTEKVQPDDPESSSDPPKELPKAESKRKQSGLNIKVDDKTQEVTVNAGDSELDRYIEKRVREKLDNYDAFKTDAGKARAIRDAKENLPTLMFLLLPVFALLLKFFYWGTGRYYAEHLIFSLHFHSFAFVLLIVTTLINLHDLWNWVPLAMLIYLFVAMRTVYKQGILKTSTRLFGVLIGYVIAIVLLSIVVLLATFLL